MADVNGDDAGVKWRQGAVAMLWALKTSYKDVDVVVLVDESGGWRTMSSVYFRWCRVVMSMLWLWSMEVAVCVWSSLHFRVWCVSAV